ncbi:MAG: hypothetical protein COA46_05800 [Porticoccaceae bacterium]|nr:MAG: hypothetical protein COA46_05800 [Porticoccaceae bacterium]
MIFTADDLRHLVIRDTLNYLDDWSLAAENLLLGTAAQESGLGGWNKGRRVGLYHITPAMHRAVWDKYLVNNPSLASEVRGMAGQQSFFRAPHGELVTNLKYATAIAWMIYRRANQQLPDAQNPIELGKFWHRHFHPKAKGTVADFVSNYQLLIQEQEMAVA